MSALKLFETLKFFLEDRGPFSEKKEIWTVYILWIERECTDFILKSVK